MDATDRKLDKVEGDLLRAKRELDTLRLSIVRIAEATGINRAEIPGHVFFGASETDERGWNRLCAIIINHLEKEYGLDAKWSAQC